MVEGAWYARLAARKVLARSPPFGGIGTRPLIAGVLPCAHREREEEPMKRCDPPDFARANAGVDPDCAAARAWIGLRVPHPGLSLLRCLRRDGTQARGNASPLGA